MKHLKPITADRPEWVPIEDHIREVFRRRIYLPLLKIIEVSPDVLQNSTATDFEHFRRAMISGRITYNRGKFSGKFNSFITRYLTSHGATWNYVSKSFSITQRDLPREAVETISTSLGAFQKKLDQLDAQLRQISPAEIAKRINVKDLFDKAIYNVDKDCVASLEAVSVQPKLTDREKEKISREWENNLRKYVKGFVPEQIEQLRSLIKASFDKGNRYEDLIQTIQYGFGVAASKAKFLARQETKLLTAKYVESRYATAGVTEYKWMNVTGTALHPVRPMHKALGDRSKAGELFKFSAPPVTNPEGKTNNPGEDYNCRCFAIPVVKG